MKPARVKRTRTPIAAPPAAAPVRETPAASAAVALRAPGFGRWSAAGAVAAALLVRAVVLAQLHDHTLLQPSGGLDTGAYVALARRAADGDWALGPDPYFVSPLYLYFLAALFRVFGPGLLLPRLVQVLLGTAAVALVSATARRLFVSGAAAAAAGWLLALTGVVAFHEILLLQSSLDPFLSALALFALVRAIQAERWPAFAAAGAAFGLLAANRPNALPVLLVVCATYVLLRRTRRSLAHAAALLAGLGLVLAPFAIRNRLVSGEWILVSSHGGLNFYIGNNAEADGTYHAVPGITPAIEGQATDAARVASQALGRAASASEVSRYFYRRALAWAAEEPRAALVLLARKIAFVLNRVEVPLNYSYAYYSRDEATLLRALAVGSWLLVPLGLLGLLVHPPVRDRAAWGAWSSFVPAYALAVAVFFVSARYRLALLVPLAVASGAALAQLAGWASRRRWKPLAGAVLALAALGTLCGLDLRLDDGRGEERSEMVLHQLAAGREQAALELLASTEPLLANPGLLHYRVGLVYRERGDEAAAARHFARALEAEPGQADIRLSLGESLLATGQAAAAEPHLRAARDAGVEPVEAGYALGRALAASGRTAEAVVELRRTLADLPRSRGPALALGLLALSLGAPDVAEPALRFAVAREPASAEAREALGLLLAQSGRGDEARLALAQAARLDPARASVRFNLAVLSLRSGRLDDARRELRAALAIEPGYAQATQLLEKLEAPRGVPGHTP